MHADHPFLFFLKACLPATTSGIPIKRKPLMTGSESDLCQGQSAVISLTAECQLAGSESLG